MEQTEVYVGKPASTYEAWLDGTLMMRRTWPVMLMGADAAMEQMLLEFSEDMKEMDQLLADAEFSKGIQGYEIIDSPLGCDFAFTDLAGQEHLVRYLLLGPADAPVHTATLNQAVRALLPPPTQ